VAETRIAGCAMHSCCGAHRCEVLAELRGEIREDRDASATLHQVGTIAQGLSGASIYGFQRVSADAGMLDDAAAGSAMAVSCVRNRSPTCGRRLLQKPPNTLVFASAAPTSRQNHQTWKMTAAAPSPWSRSFNASARTFSHDQEQLAPLI
jgi:hypothetical protein